MTTDLAPLHPDANGFKLFRGLPNGKARDYTGVEFTRGWPGGDQFLRQLRLLGYVRNSSTDTSGYGVLDVLNADDDIVQDYDIPTAEAFRYVKRKLKLRVLSSDPAGEPEPTPGQWATLDFALRVKNGWVTDPVGSGVTRRLPALRRRGWVDEHDRITAAGRHVATGWAYDEQTGELYVANRCQLCRVAVHVGQCCSFHGKNMCHRCYRVTHFVEVCVKGCTECAHENLPLIYPPTRPNGATAGR